MHLEYNILWCEDNDKWFEQRSEELTPLLEDATGLPVRITLKPSVEGINVETLNSYDLFLVDYNLRTQTKGSDLIAILRSEHVCASIIFYSADGEDILRKELFEKRIDGVFVLFRHDAEFNETVCSISRTVVKKMLDVNALRGLLITEVAEIERKMGTLIAKTCFPVGSNSSMLDASRLLAKYKDKILKQHDKERLKLETSISSIEDLHSCRSFDLYKKACFVQNLIQELQNVDEADTILSCLRRLSPTGAAYSEVFYKEVINVRNPSAHQSEENVARLYCQIADVEYTKDNLFVVLDTIRARLKRHDDFISEMLSFVEARRTGS